MLKAEVGKCAVALLVCTVFFGAVATGAQQSKDVLATRAVQSLDGSDWRLGSFPMEAGLAAGAESETYNDSGFRRVQVPGEVQLQLGIKGQDLYRQSKELNDINNREWWYRKNFRAAATPVGKRALLQFEGADYFASVWLNGKLLGEHEGTFVPFSFDVTGLLRPGRNNLLVVRVTHPWIPKDRGLAEYMNGNFTLISPGDSLTLSHPPYAIRANWDGLPAHGNAAFAMGLWRSVNLTTVDAVHLTDLYARTLSIAADGSARVLIGGTVENDGPGESNASVHLDVTPSTFEGAALPRVTLPVHAAPGKTNFQTEIHVDHARLWWTWDSGAQDLYRVAARLQGNSADSMKPQAASDLKSVRFGIRTVTRDADMTFRLNGKRIFIKASWFPIEDYYGSRATRDGYDRDLRLFRDANLNLLVNFTVVEKPDFYDLCDDLGVLIVVEMPFPQFGPGAALGEASPRRKPFLLESAKEIGQIVTMLRSHPSVAEWAPIAESHDANGNWGFGETRFDQTGYQAFSDSMRELVGRLSPDTIFHPSLCDLGEKHFWMATAGYRGDSGDYQQHFDAKIGFVSEFGGISMSSAEKLGEYLTPKEQWDPDNHASPRWYGLPIDISAYSYLASSEYDALYSMLYRSEHYIDRDIRSPREMVDATQTYQAFLLKYATEAYRRKKYDPIMGERFWDFLEIGPGFRFGIVDLDRIPKVGYWWMKRAEARLAVNFAYKDALEAQVAGSKLDIPVWAINDLDHVVDAKIECSVYDVHGKKLLAQSFASSIPTDGKAMAGTLSLTLPDEPGVYLVRAVLTSSRPEDTAEDTTFVKVVPRAFAQPVRVLLIGQATSTAPIAAMLRSAGVAVDVRDEESIGRFDDLADGVALHRHYDVIWLSAFENFAHIFDPRAAHGIKEAVSAGSGFIHTGGDSSYHGGQARQALVEFTELADLLPVAIQNRNDLVYGEHTMDDNLQSEAGFHDIAASAGENRPEAALLQHYGIRAFNQVTARPESHTLLQIDNQPLLVTGSFGQGLTVAFTGFTPMQAKNVPFLTGQQLICESSNRAYFETFLDLVALATGKKTTTSLEGLLDAFEKPLFQTLKEQPKTQIAVRIEQGTATSGSQADERLVVLRNGLSYAHLVRLRVEWADDKPAPYLTEFSDNAFELLPGEEKQIVLSWRMSVPNSVPAGFLVVDGANAAPIQVSIR